MAGNDLQAKRLANIQRNQQLLRELQLPSLAQGLADRAGAAAGAGSPVKRKAPGQTSAGARKARTVVATRRSSRIAGYDPEGNATGGPARPTPLMEEEEMAAGRRAGPLTLEQACSETQDLKLAEEIVSRLSSINVEYRHTVRKAQRAWKKPTLTENHVCKVTPNRVMAMIMHPSATQHAVFAGDTHGYVGVWLPKYEDVEVDPEETCATFMPHSRAITALCSLPAAPSRIVSTSYDGAIRLLDVDAMMFQEVAVDEGVGFTSVDVLPDSSTLFCGNSYGLVRRIDLRAPVLKDEWEIHTRKISQLHLNPTQPHLFVTSSVDTTASVWDIRQYGKKNPKPLVTLQHHQGVTAVQWSPDGTRFVTTSNDDTIGVLALNANPTSALRIKHNNHTGRWLTSFHTIWDPQAPNTVVIGNMTRAVDMFDATTGAKIGEYSSEFLTAVPTLNALHATDNVMVSATGSGRLCYWTQ